MFTRKQWTVLFASVIAAFFVTAVTGYIIYTKNHIQTLPKEAKIQQSKNQGEIEGNPQKNEEAEVTGVAAVTVQKDVVGPLTKLEFQTVNQFGEVATVNVEKEMAFQGMTKEELEMILTDWQLQSFSPSKVVFRKYVESKVTPKYYIGEHNGFVAVYAKNQDGELELQEVLTMPISSLPEKDQARIRAGISVETEEELYKILQDYTS